MDDSRLRISRSHGPESIPAYIARLPELDNRATDRAKPGSKRHVVVDARGLPLAALLTAANVTDSVIFAAWLFYALSAGSLFVFRRTMPDAVRPYRAFGYPWVPALFIVVTGWLISPSSKAKAVLENSSAITP